MQREGEMLDEDEVSSSECTISEPISTEFLEVTRDLHDPLLARGFYNAPLCFLWVRQPLVITSCRVLSPIALRAALQKV